MTTNEFLSDIDPSPEQQEQLLADYKFVFCYHTEEFADQISEAVQDCDTVAFEYAGFQSGDERLERNEKLTAYVSTTATEQQKAEVHDWLAKSANGDYLGAVLEGLQGSDKKIALLDIDEDNPDYYLANEYWVANKGYYRAVRDGSTVKEVKQASVAFIEAAVSSFQVRETATVDQLQVLGRAPGRIGVVTGVMHTPVLEKLSKDAETSSVVIGPEVTVIDEVTTVKYDDLDILIQQARANGVENIDETLLDRAVLTDIIRSYDIDFGKQSLEGLVKSLQPEETNDLLRKIDEIREAGSQYNKGFLRLMMTKNDIADALRTTWPMISEIPKVAVRKVN